MTRRKTLYVDYMKSALYGCFNAVACDTTK